MTGDAHEDERPLRRLLYGGSFDPVHTGHTAVAAAAGRLAGADVVSLVPAADPPHKDGTHASAVHRLAMCRLVAEELPGVDVLDIEITRGGVSYTIDTVEALLAGPCRGEQLMLLIGQDSVPLLPTWRRIDELLRIVPVAVAPRPEAADPDWESLEKALGREACRGLRQRWLATPRHAISSTAIRQRVAEGRSIRCFVPDPVADYVAAEGLYCPAEGVAEATSDEAV